MNTFISNLPFRTKLLVLLLLPLLTIVVLSAEAGWVRYGLLSEMRQLRRLVTLSTHAGALLHETQKERGLTAVSMDSRAGAFQAELVKQRLATDTAQKKLNDFAASHVAGELAGNAGAGRAWQQLRESAGRMEATRQSIDRGEVTAGDALAFYTQVNEGLLRLVASLVENSSDPKIVRRIAGYSYLLQAKERTGLERAVLSAALARGMFDASSYHAFSELVYTQRALLSVFAQIAPESSRRALGTGLREQYVRETERLERDALLHGTGRLSGEARRAFATITEKINDLHKVERAISGELLEEARALEARALGGLILNVSMALAALAVTATVGLLISMNITGRFRTALRSVDRIISGDLRERLPADGKDEVGVLARAVNSMTEHMQSLVADVAGGARSLDEASDAMSEASRTLASGTEETSQQSELIAAAAEQMSQNLQVLASAMEEMSITIGDVAKRGSEAAQVAEAADRLGRSTGETIGNLSRDVSAVGGVIESITAIADQTRMLALNASIEAANAGESGRGFSVVAAEVKDLARQSADFASEVARTLGQILAGTTRSRDSLSEMLAIFRNLHENIGGIASAVEEQSTTVREINGNVSQAAQAAGDVAANVSHISTATRDGARAAGQAAGQAGSMRDLSVRLSKRIQGFSA